MQPEKVTVADESLSRLREATDRLEICDPLGRTLGFFLPPDLYREWLYAWAKTQFDDEVGPEFTDDASPPMTTGEAIHYLEHITRSSEGAV